MISRSETETYRFGSETEACTIFPPPTYCLARHVMQYSHNWQLDLLDFRETREQNVLILNNVMESATRDSVFPWFMRITQKTIRHELFHGPSTFTYIVHKTRINKRTKASRWTSFTLPNLWRAGDEAKGCPYLHATLFCNFLYPWQDSSV